MAKYQFRTKPTPEQLKALKKALERERFGIFFQQRVGKTKVAIDFCAIKHLQKGAMRVAIVCPLSVRSEWVSQLEEHMPLNIPYDVRIYPSNEVQINITLKDTRHSEVLTFLIINYDKLTSHKARLAWWDADIYIFDESHLLKNHTSQRSKASAWLTQKYPMVLLLTGTPVTKSWTDIFSQFKVMNDRILGKKWSDFKRKYAVMGGYMGKQIVGCTDLDYIRRAMKNHSVRVLRKNVMDEPEIEEIVLTVPFEPKAQKLYDDLRRSWVAELDSGAVVTSDMAVTRLMRLQQFCGGFATANEGVTEHVSSAKVKLLKDLVDTKASGGEKVVIFHRYRAEARLIEQALTGYNVGFYNGGISEEDRQWVKQAFQDGKLDAIVVQISTGAMGVSFDKAHINIFYSLDFSLQNYLQARDRVMGRFQKSDVVTNYFLAIEKSVDLKVIKALRNNEEFATSVTDYKAELKEK